RDWSSDMCSSDLRRRFSPANWANSKLFKCVGRGEHAWTCERHLKGLLFAQFAGLKSLREIVEGLGGQRAAFYHLNLRAPCRSTLADANRARPAAVFRDIAQALIPVAARLQRDGEGLVRLLDSTPLALKGEGFAWGEARGR